MNILFVPETPSTQIIAREWAQTGNREYAAVYTDHQTAGRGRLDSEWLDEPGACLLTSLVMWDPPVEENPGLLGVAAALACARMLETAIPMLPPVMLKYPNDLLLHGMKLGGVLVEVIQQSAIIGVGINLTQESFPDSLQETAISAHMGLDTPLPELDREFMIQLLWENLQHLIVLSADALYPLWHERDATRGRRYIALDLPEQPVGEAVRVETNFQLRLRFPDSNEHLTYHARGV
ncbi:MAG: biotin--[acetyl-CoA-carboxylase] ligase [Fimbriimonadia bacterium]|nr:biotin--[acetyl-CoA-carboxylase] ligase [Fimbriimonadia bacterium]